MIFPTHLGDAGNILPSRRQRHDVVGRIASTGFSSIDDRTDDFHGSRDRDHLAGHIRVS